MADNAAVHLDLVLGRLDSDAEAFSCNREMKELHLNLREAYTLLLLKMKNVKVKQNVNTNSLFTHLQDLASDVDGFIDEPPGLSITRFDQNARRIHGRSVQLLNFLRRLGVDESSAISHAATSRSDETDLGRSIKSVIQILLQDRNLVQFIHVVGVNATKNFGIAHGAYTNGDVESYFPFRFWFSSAENLDLSTVIKTITIKCKEIPSSERLLIVLHGVCDLTDAQLDNLRLLIADTHVARFCVLVTTHSDLGATMMGALPAEHLTYLSDFSCELPHSTRNSLTLESGSAVDEDVTSCPQFLVEVDTVATTDSLEVDPLMGPWQPSKTGTSSVNEVKSFRRSAQKNFGFVNGGVEGLARLLS